MAIIDSGVADLPDFYTGGTSRIVYSQSFVGTEGGADPNGNSPADEFGHGTHVAGILAGNGNGTVYIGTCRRPISLISGCWISTAAARTTA